MRYYKMFDGPLNVYEYPFIAEMFTIVCFSYLIVMPALL